MANTGWDHSKFAKAVLLLNAERKYQESLIDKKGNWPDGKPAAQTPEEYMAAINYQQGAFQKAARSGDTAGMMDAMRQITALGVACMEVNETPRRAGF